MREEYYILMKKNFEEIYAEIEKNDSIIIHRHVRPDPDALGSQRGLALLIKNKFPDKKVFTVGQEVDGLSYLGTMDEVSNEIFPNSLIIVTDTANRSRIDDKRYSKGNKLIKIDHHPDDDVYGDISLVNTKASSCSEIIADFSFYLDERLPMTAESAQLLYAGIVADTGRFLYPATTPHTLEVASKLMEFDFSASEISQLMNTNTKKVAHLSGYVLQNIMISEEGVAHIILTQNMLKEYKASDEDTAPLVSLPGTIEGVLCWAIFVEQPTGTYRCRLRSKGPVINEIAKLHDGGGHPLASGANAEDQKEIEEILAQFEELAKNWNTKQ